MNRDCWVSVLEWLEVGEVLRMTAVCRSFHRWGRAYLERRAEVIFLESPRQLIEAIYPHRQLVVPIQDETLNLEQVSLLILWRVRWVGREKVTTLSLNDLQLSGHPIIGETVNLSNYPDLQTLVIDGSSTTTMTQLFQSSEGTSFFPPGLRHLVLGPNSQGIIYLPWPNHFLDFLLTLTLLNCSSEDEDEIRLSLSLSPTTVVLLP